MHLDKPNSSQDMKHFHHLTKFPHFSSPVYHLHFPQRQLLLQFFLTRSVFPVLELYIKETIQYKLFPVELLTLIFWRGIRVGGVSPFLLLLNGMTWYEFTNLFIQSPIDSHLHYLLEDSRQRIGI